MTMTALVTGGNKGIGLEVTRRLSLLGYKVIVVARDVENRAELDAPNIVKEKFDLTNVDLIPDLISRLGDIDLLINNAGLMHSLPYDQYPEEKMRELMKLNIEAPVALIREVSKYMISKGSGRIVNNASIAGHIGHPDVWYGISKAGLINATKSFAKVLGPQGIVVNAVAPGLIDTDFSQALMQNEAMVNRIKNGSALGRVGDPGDIAGVIAFLLSDASRYISGQTIVADGGTLIADPL